MQTTSSDDAATRRCNDQRTRCGACQQKETGAVPLPTYNQSVSQPSHHLPLALGQLRLLSLLVQFIQLSLRATLAFLHLAELPLGSTVEDPLLRHARELFAKTGRDSLVVVQGPFQLPLLAYTGVVNELLDEAIISHGDLLKDLGCFLAFSQLVHQRLVGSTQPFERRVCFFPDFDDGGEERLFGE